MLMGEPTPPPLPPPPPPRPLRGEVTAALDGWGEVAAHTVPQPRPLWLGDVTPTRLPAAAALRLEEVVTPLMASAFGHPRGGAGPPRVAPSAGGLLANGPWPGPWISG